MKLDICVVSYNTKEYVKRFLDTLHNDDNKQWELFISDNGSTDGTREFLEANKDNYRLKEVIYNDNIGYSGACNQLATLGDSEVVGLFNADIWMRSADVTKMLDRFQSDPEVAILGPKQRNEQGLVVHAGIFGSLRKPFHRGWRVIDHADAQFREFIPCLTVSGSAYLVRRSVWDELTRCPIYQASSGGQAIGAFLATPHYYEETFCSYHSLTHGFKIFYDGTVSIGHSWHASSPVGGSTDRDKFAVSQQIFRKACDDHAIPHD